VRLEKGFLVWAKEEKAKLSAHFSTEEFECKCALETCGPQRVSARLVALLEETRTDYGLPIRVTSGFRCQGYQAQLRAQGYETAKGLSQHELGRAADIAGTDMRLLEVAASEYFKAIGIARTFVHVDLRADKERRWTYK
jgi:uncharacterized protein YcbK (DUF882 family)